MSGPTRAASRRRAARTLMLVVAMLLVLTSRPRPAASTPPHERVLDAHHGPIASSVVSADAQWVASAGLDGTVRVWDARRLSLVRTLGDRHSEMFAVAFSPDARQIAGSSYDGRVTIWARDSGRLLRTLHLPDWSVALAYSPDGTVLAAGGQDGTVHVFDARTWTRVSAGRLNGTITALVFLGDRDHLAVAADRVIHIFNVSIGGPEKTLGTHRNTILSLAASSDHHLVLAGSLDRTAAAWDVETNAASWSVDGSTSSRVTTDSGAVDVPVKLPVGSVAWKHGSTELLAVAIGSEVRVYRPGRHEPLAVLKGHARAVTSLSFADTSDVLASSSSDGTIRLWTVPAPGAR